MGALGEGLVLSGTRSTRIFVRGLPPKFTDDDFKSYFSKKGAITDCRLIPSRRIGYVGYKTSEEALAAVKYFNKSFIRMSRIGVEIARTIEDENLPRAWSARTPGSTAYKRKNESSASHNVTAMSLGRTGKRKRSDTGDRPKGGVFENDPKFKEFLEVMQPKSKSKTWGNEDLVSFSQDLGGQVSQPDPADAEGSDGKYEDISAQKKKPNSSNPKAMDIDHIEHEGPPTDGTQLDDEELYNTVGGGPTGVSDAEWLRSKTSRLLDLTDDVESHLARASEAGDTRQDTKKTNGVDEERGEVGGDTEAKEQPGHSIYAKAEMEQAMEVISQSGRLYLRNLPYSSTEEDLRRYFAPYGDLVEAHLPIDSKTHLSKGFAYILYQNPQHAVQAYQSLDRNIFQGRLLHILAASPKREHKLDEYAISKLPLKKQREIKRKATAASSTLNWNSMYMNADAVISSVADRLGISKAELLDPTSSDAAVRQAHAETHVIQETKAYFSQHGMDLKAFEKREKDDKIILFKNFPYGTRAEDIRDLVEPFGKVARVLMPPAGTIAVVEFTDTPAARAAFASLAYSRFKETVLFLEKAPKGLFIEGFTPKIIDAPKLPAAVALGKDCKVSATDLLLPTHTTTTDEAEAG
ncbi:RNA-binding domain-containing protein, partial [Tuber magnatum]